MFTDEMLETMLTHKDARGIPIGMFTTAISICERVLENCGYDFTEDDGNATIHKSELL